MRRPPAFSHTGVLSPFHSFVGASFAVEELILLNPYHHVYHTLYAEVSEGGQEQEQLALNAHIINRS